MGFGKTNVSGGNNDEKLQAHLSDKGNPHGVTAEQIGAMARGGYGYYSGNIDDLKTAGCYLCVNISGGAVPTGSEWFTVFVIAGGTGSFIHIASGAVSAGLWVRHHDGNAWSTWKRMAATDDLANYLPLSGGIMTGALSVNNNLAIFSGHTDSASTLAQLQAVKDNQNSALLQLERPLDNQTWPNVALYQRVNGGDFTRIGNFLHTGNIANYSSKVVAGTYTGNGNESMTINLGFTPKAVLLLAADDGTCMLYEWYGVNYDQYNTPRESALCLQGQTLSNGSYKVMSVGTNGFTVYFYSVDGSKYGSNYRCHGNESGKKFNYIAFG